MNESMNGGWITGNFGGTFSSFKLDSKREFSSFRASSNIDKLIQKYDSDIKTSIPGAISSALKDLRSKNNNSLVIQSQKIVFEEEKKMKEEKQKLLDNINKYSGNMRKSIVRNLRSQQRMNSLLWSKSSENSDNLQFLKD